MALLSKKEFAEQCGLGTNNLSNYISRGNVLIRKDDLIDTDNEKNRAFLQKRKSKTGAVQEKPTRPAAVQPEQDEDDDFYTDSPLELDEIPPYDISERLLKHLDTKKREREIALLKIKEEKINGTVIPSELIKPVFLQHNQSILTEFKNGADRIIQAIAVKKRLTGSEVAELRGEMTAIINESMDKAIATSIKTVEGIVSDHTERKGVGERN